MRISDWSSDVCSSDLPAPPVGQAGRASPPSPLQMHHTSLRAFSLRFPPLSHWWIRLGLQDLRILTLVETVDRRHVVSAFRVEQPPVVKIIRHPGRGNAPLRHYVTVRHLVLKAAVVPE